MRPNYRRPNTRPQVIHSWKVRAPRNTELTVELPPPLQPSQPERQPLRRYVLAVALRRSSELASAI